MVPCFTTTWLRYQLLIDLVTVDAEITSEPFGFAQGKLCEHGIRCSLHGEAPADNGLRARCALAE